MRGTCLDSLDGSQTAHTSAVIVPRKSDNGSSGENRSTEESACTIITESHSGYLWQQPFSACLPEPQSAAFSGTGAGTDSQEKPLTSRDNKRDRAAILHKTCIAPNNKQLRNAALPTSTPTTTMCTAFNTGDIHPRRANRGGLFTFMDNTVKRAKMSSTEPLPANDR